MADPFGIQQWLDDLRDADPQRHAVLHVALCVASKEMRNATAPPVLQTFGAQLEQHLEDTAPDADADIADAVLAAMLAAATPADRAPG